MEKAIVRDAKVTDLKELLQFEQELIKAERPFDPTIASDPISYYDIEQYILHNDVKVLVVEIENEIVASGYALKKEARGYLDHEYYAYLGFMFCKPAHRGKGLVQRLINMLKLWAKEEGLFEVRLTVYHDNIRAVKAYEKSGFRSHLNEMRLRLD